MTDAPSSNTNERISIAWNMSAALENVPRGDTDLAEVTNLEGAVRAWLGLDPDHRIHARLSTEQPIQLQGVPTAVFTGDAIGVLAEHLPV